MNHPNANSENSPLRPSNIKKKLSATQKMAATAGSLSLISLLPASTVDADFVFVSAISNPISIALGDAGPVSWDVDGIGGDDFELSEILQTASFTNLGNFYYFRYARIYVNSVTIGNAPLNGRGLIAPLANDVQVQALPLLFDVGPTLAPVTSGDKAVFQVPAEPRCQAPFNFKARRAATNSSGMDPAFAFPFQSSFVPGDNFVGFRFEDALGQLHYGWADLNFDLDAGTLSITRWAYQSEANRSIHIIPEPSSLALLGFGAAGLLMLRDRKRKCSGRSEQENSSP